MPPFLVLVFIVVMRDRPIGLHKYGEAGQLVVAFPSSSSPVAPTELNQTVSREMREVRIISVSIIRQGSICS